MKKVTALFFLCFLIFVSFNNKDNEEAIFVNYIDNNSYQKIYLKFDNGILNTKNFNEYFNENIKIISFYSFKNKYNCVYGVNRYLFRFNDLNNNIEGYKDFYNKIYNINSYKYFKGYPISVVEVDIDSKSLDKILNKNKNIKYSNDICGNYQ